MADPEVDDAGEIEHCYRHPREETRVHCTRCGRPICPDCMHPAPVGHHCPECVAEARRAARLPVGRRAQGAVRRLGRPGGATTILLAANLTVFVAEVVLSRGSALGLGVGGRSTIATLLDMGGMSPILVASGDWWRLITAMFLHVSLIHVGFNCLVLYQLGPALEDTLGTTRMVAIYFVGGFLASVTSYLFSDPQVVAVGASGAVFALAGAWLAYHYRRRDMRFSRGNVQSIWMFLAINLVIGFSLPNIDNFAHLGGFVAGVALGVVLEGFGPPQVRPFVRVGGTAALAAVGVALVVFRTGQLCVQEVFGTVVRVC